LGNAQDVDMKTPTAEEIEAAMTPAGGWTKAQLAEWGVAWPPQKGWKKRLLSIASKTPEAEIERTPPWESPGGTTD
jgi:hypothetical protein